MKRPKLRIWYYVTNSFDYNIEKPNSAPSAKAAPEKRYSTSRLAELSLIVDTKGAYQGETNGGEINVER
jgi:hypothetical protein